MQNPILVTGCGRRVGFHIASRLQQDGYQVLAHYRTDTADVQKLRDSGIDVIQADFADTAAILSFVQSLKTRFPQYRGIIHNASAFAPTETDLAAAARQYQTFFNVHMLAPFLINQGLTEKLQGDNGDPADIIHITDINVENPMEEYDIYSSTKAGLHSLTMSHAKKYAPSIKVNSIALGPVLFSEDYSEKRRENTLKKTPLGIEGGVEVVYLAIKSFLTNKFLAGTKLDVDGGRRLFK